MTVGEDGLYVVHEVRIASAACRAATPRKDRTCHISHTTQTSSMPLPIPPRPHALKPRRICGIGRPPENIDETLKSLEVHEATTALVNDSNSWVKWAYLKNGVACTPAEANDEDYRLGIAAATDGK